jgi:hypothetical protein
MRKEALPLILCSLGVFAWLGFATPRAGAG